MNNNRRRVLDMLAEGKIGVEPIGAGDPVQLLLRQLYFRAVHARRRFGNGLRLRDRRTDQDVKRANDALKNDPFFKAHTPWRKALEQLLKMGVRAEQQALAKWGLNFVIEEYLPAKLRNPRAFLP